MGKQIIVDISPTGEVKVTTKGWAGSLCKLASRWLEEALGLKTADTPTAELYQTEQTARKVEQ
jgi:hypothetical protein